MARLPELFPFEGADVARLPRQDTDRVSVAAAGVFCTGTALALNCAPGRPIIAVGRRHKSPGSGRLILADCATGGSQGRWRASV